MLTLKRVSAFLFLLTGAFCVQKEPWLGACPNKNYVLLEITETDIVILCLRSNELVESDIKCAYEQYKEIQNNIQYYTDIEMLKLVSCTISTNLAYQKILQVLEVPEETRRRMKKILIFMNQRPLSSKQLTGLESVTDFEINDTKNRINIETLTTLQHLKKLRITTEFLENVTSNATFTQLEELFIVTNTYSTTKADNKNILRDLSSISNKLKIFIISEVDATSPPKVIEKESFGQNQELEELHLSITINSIEKDAFDNLQNLRKLILTGCKIENIVPEKLPTSLKHLDLSSNKLKSFVMIKHLSNLEVLNLAKNQILSFTLNLKDFPLKLQKISLADNHLKRLHVIGSWAASLKKVNLTNNDIENLDAWRWIYKHKRNVSYDGTYAVCDCKLKEILNESKKLMYLEKFMEKCRLPIPDGFVVRIAKFNCQTERRSNCTMYADNTPPSQVAFNCSNTYSHLTDRFALFDKYLLLYNIKILHIYLSGNQAVESLPEFPELKDKTMNKNIYAENCRITHPFLINNLANTQNLKRLYMANNNIAEIEVLMLQRLEKMGTKLTLSGNPFRCDCEHQHMYDTLTQIRFFIEDFDQMTCDDGSHFVPNRMLCFQWKTFFLSFTIAVLIIFLSLSIFYIFFSLEVKIFIYSRGWFPAMFRPDTDGQIFEYDVFVSYSDLDEEFIYSIIDYLENEISPPLKVCHHNRNWIGGDRIDRQIINSVDMSRKTLIFLSRNFLTSYWGSLEFRTAFYTMLHEKTSKLVLIIYGDIGPLDELKPEIRSYIKTTTYLAWENKWFWKRLAYSLRRPKDAKMNIEKEEDQQPLLMEEDPL